MTKESLPRASDSALAPAGQLVLDGAAGQLGLDGRVYAPPGGGGGESPPLSGEAANPPLGLLHALSHGCLPGLNMAPPGYQQLDMWGRLEVARQLVKDTRFNRQAKCHVCRRVTSGEVELRGNASGSTTLHGVVWCGLFACPGCGPRRARDVAATIGALMHKHEREHEYGDAWMLSLTIPHYADEPTALVVDRLYAASAEFWRTAEWRAFAAKWGVGARVRVLDATHGGRNGSHPHFHVALFPTSTVIGWREESGPARVTYDEDGNLLSCEQPGMTVRTVAGLDKEAREAWLDVAADELRDAWQRCVLATGAGPRDAKSRAAFERHSLKLSPSERAARYFTKWGLADEVGKSTHKANNHLTLLDLARTNARAGAAYLVFRAATEGRAWVTGLADACAWLGVTDEDAAAYLARLREARDAELRAEGAEPPAPRAVYSVIVRRHLWTTAVRVGLGDVVGHIRQLADAGATVDELQRELDAFLWSRLAVGGHALLHGAQGPPDDG